jgi:transcriptional regulator with XRE-family HTH domain
MSRTFPLTTPLSRVMHARGLRVIDVVYATGYSHRAVRQWVHGDVVPSPPAMAALCTALRTTPESLGYAPPPQPES